VILERPGCFLPLAAEPLSAARSAAVAFAPTWTTSPVKTRVGVSRRRASGRLSRRRRFRSMFTPGSRACAYRTASGRAKWPNRDPLEESGGLNLYTFVLNSPTRYVDRDGLDIWIEGPNQREPNLHQSVCVGDPNGNYKSYSFGANGNWVIGGEVYEDTSLGGAIEQYKKTTPEQDQQFRDQMDQELRKKGIYGITDICRSYSQRKFKKAPGNKCPPPSRIPVPPNRTGPSSSRGTSTTGTSTSR